MGRRPPAGPARQAAVSASPCVTPARRQGRRFPRTLGPWALAIGCATAVACGPEAPSESASADPDDAPDSIVVTDAEGERLALPGPARRIVSLVPSATRTLHAIGASGAVVGRTDYDTQAWASTLPSVGGGLEPSLEAVTALAPDLVVRFGGEQDPRTAGRLRDLDIPYLTVRPDRVEDIWETARLLGAVTGREHAADSLVHALEEGLRDVERAVSGWPRRRVAYVLGGTPPWVSGPGTYIDQILARVGGDNVFADLDALYSSVSPEELRTRGIDVVLVSGDGAYDEALTPGARVARIGSELEIPGPEVVEAARSVAAALHGRPVR